MTQNRIPYVWTNNGITMVLKGRSYSLARDAATFPDLVAAIREGKDAETLLNILNRPAREMENATKVTANVKVRDGVVYFKDEPIHNSLADRMLAMLDEGLDLTPMALFLENLMSNPSRTAVQELYSFLEKGKMPITPDGCFMAYKAVRSDYKDIHSGTMDNSIGTTVEMPRNRVDDNRERTCSYGLHFCSFDYLPYFAHANGHVVLVKINPADVVSIPADYNDTKGRCCKYDVVDEYVGYYEEKRPYFNSMVYDPYSDDEYDNEETIYTIRGYYDNEDFEDGDEGELIDEVDSLGVAKHIAVDNVGDYAVIVVFDNHDDTVFELRGR